MRPAAVACVASPRADRQQERVTRNKTEGLPVRHGASWNAEEDDRLRTRFLAGEAIAALANAHQRKNGAITARLIKLGLISEDGEVLVEVS